MISLDENFVSLEQNAIETNMRDRIDYAQFFPPIETLAEEERELVLELIRFLNKSFTEVNA